MFVFILMEVPVKAGFGVHRFPVFYMFSTAAVLRDLRGWKRVMQAPGRVALLCLEVDIYLFIHF